MKLTPEQVNTISKGEQEIAGYFHMLLAVIDKQAKRIETLERRVHEPGFHSIIIRPNAIFAW